MEHIKVSIDNVLSGIISHKDGEYYYNYEIAEKPGAPVSLAMQYRERTWEWKYNIHPIFDMNIPEGYLFEIFKNILQKEFGTINDFLLLSVLGPNIKGRLTFKGSIANREIESRLPTLDEVIDSKDEDLFDRLLKMFLFQSGVSGMQPKLLTTLQDKSFLRSGDYIVKTFGDEYPHLAENEYFCMKIIKMAGVPVPEFYLSKNRKYFIVKRFDLDDKGKYLGFEEICCLQGKNSIDKYRGSYEGVAKTFSDFVSKKYLTYSLRILYKMIVLSFLLKNGDAHLKNFGILYSSDISKRFISPAYDVVCTAPYIRNDKPALTLFGKKIWFGKKKIMDFGSRYCMLSRQDTILLFDECIDAVDLGMREIEEYIKDNKSFETIGKIMLNSFRSSYENI